MTEIPEHLLKRSRERREALGLSQPEAPTGEAAPAATPAVPEAAATPAPAAARTPAPVPAAPAPPPPKPDPPYVAAAKARSRIPWWAMPVLAGLPVWASIYAFTLEESSSGPADPLALGQEIYGACASCHGGSGGGQGSIPGFTDGQIIETWPNWQDHIAWVALGTQNWPHPTYGANEQEVGGNGIMPGWENQLTPEEIALVVRYEREVLGGAEPEEDLVALTEAIAAEEPATAEGTDVAATLEESMEPGDGPGGTRPPPDGG